MRKLWSLVIVGVLLLAAHPASRAASSSSDWPSLGSDAAQSNDNAAETAITAHNVLKLKVRWTAPIADVSYPIVVAGRVYVPMVSHAHIHVWVLDAATGKRLSVIFRDAPGGMLMVGGNLYVAGRYLQEVDPAKGTRLSRIDATPSTANGVFLYPVADQKLLVAG